MCDRRRHICVGRTASHEEGTTSFTLTLQQKNVLSPATMTALTKVHLRLFKHIELVNRIWLDSVDAARKSEMELGARLLKCTDTGDALVICQEWMSRRVINFVADNHRITKLWLDFARETAGEESDEK
jgi:hypothetical protein